MLDQSSLPGLLLPILAAQAINLLHNQPRPLHGRRNQLVRSGTSMGSAEQIIRCAHVQAGENRGHDTDDALAGFVQVGNGIRFAFCSSSWCARQ